MISSHQSASEPDNFEPIQNFSQIDDQSGLVFDIKKYSIHDGPGIRTTVFLKGCPLHCLWCHNPEGKTSNKEILFWENRCINCLDCIPRWGLGQVPPRLSREVSRAAARLSLRHDGAKAQQPQAWDCGWRKSRSGALQSSRSPQYIPVLPGIPTSSHPPCTVTEPKCRLQPAELAVGRCYGR